MSLEDLDTSKYSVNKISSGDDSNFFNKMIKTAINQIESDCKEIKISENKETEIHHEANNYYGQIKLNNYTDASSIVAVLVRSGYVVTIERIEDEPIDSFKTISSDAYVIRFR